MSRLAAAFGFAAAIGAAPQATVSVQDVAWLAGCWESTAENGRVVEEQWTRPRGGTMLGVGRTIAGERTVDHEFVVLSVVEGVLAYEAHPGGQASTTFRATEVSATRAVFEDPAHDFPQQVGYHLTSPDHLSAWVSGRRDGVARRIPFEYQRVLCAQDRRP